MSFAATYLEESGSIIKRLDGGQIEAMAQKLASLRELNGRLFILGGGSGEGDASDAVKDLRNMAG